MAPPFHLLHVPGLLVASLITYGGTKPILYPAAAVIEFGLPQSIADQPAAYPGFMSYGACVSIIGMSMWIFYLRGNLAAVDTMLSSILYLGAVEAYVFYLHGIPEGVIFRATAGVLIGGWGLLGMTTRGTRKR